MEININADEAQDEAQDGVMIGDTLNCHCTTLNLTLATLLSLRHCP